jgi:IMP cyclohydrolase
MAVVGNGSHVDPVTEKVELGYPARDALALSLLALDFEKDDYDTPRVAGVASEAGAYVAIVRRDALVVEAVSEPTLAATYEKNDPEPFELGAESAERAARELYDAEFEHAVCAAAATVEDGTVETALYNGE